MYKLSRQITLLPRSRRAVHKWLPRKPAPPVTSIFFGDDIFLSTEKYDDELDITRVIDDVKNIYRCIKLYGADFRFTFVFVGLGLTAFIYYFNLEEGWMEKKLLSIVVPIFNEENNILPLYHELIAICQSLQHFDEYEIVMVNDGSKDASLSILKDLAAHDVHIKIISFARNFGHEQATFAGIMHTKGDAVVLIDADRQDPPELILEFEKEFINGYHVVYGQRTKRLNESWLKKLTSYLFYPIFKWLTGVDMPRNVGDFCMISRKVVELLKQFNERVIFVRGLIYWLGLPKKAVPFVRRARGSGRSKYNYTKLVIFALENIVSFSTVPIYAIIFISLFLIMLCCLGTAAALCMHLYGYVVMTGWTSLIICMLFSFATTLFFLGIIGLYIGKVFQEVKGRPLFIIDELINI